MKFNKSKPARKNFFERFEKFWKTSKFDFKAKNKKLGWKKFKLMLIFIFLIIDSRNMKFTNNIAIPTNEQIANYVGCHISWVKQVKKKYFSNEELEKSEFEEYRKNLNLVFAYEKIHGWKELLLHDQEIDCDEVINPGIGKCCFKTNWKVYKNWITINSKRKIKLKFFKWSEICFDKWFDKAIVASKTGKIKKDFIKSIFKQNAIWHNVSWFWKLIFWFRNNLEFWNNKFKMEENGLLSKL